VITVHSFYASPSWLPCSIELDRVSQQYPITLWRKLTSSEPRREYAIENVSLSLNSDFTLLVGNSSSGKSTLLKLVAGQEPPVSGRILTSLVNNENTKLSPSNPVILEERPVYSNEQRSLNEILKGTILELVSTDLAKELEGSPLLPELSDLLDLSLEQKGLNFSPSESYRCCIAVACLNSMLYNYEENSKRCHSLPAPILLLDEWLDTETSTVVQKVQSSLLELVAKGAIVISITHKPKLYKMEESIRRITLSTGRILSTN
jgi:ABC-type transport system involved in cytochrome bd biosynthesis fused ATPase/permease subunit